jgi:hypothetical protein
MLTRAEIRKKLMIGVVAPGAPELDRLVEGYFIWLSSPVSRLHPSGVCVHQTPKKMMSCLRFDEASSKAMVEKSILGALLGRRAVKIVGSQSLVAALAFAKQITIQQSWIPSYLDASTLLDPEQEPEFEGGLRGIVILNLYPDIQDGKLFAEVQARIMTRIKKHAGATILVSSAHERQGGLLGELITKILKPDPVVRVVAI